MRTNCLSDEEFSSSIQSIGVCDFVLRSCPHLTESSVKMSTFTISTGSGCAKCGTIKQSGKRSCCARGGAWFKNCGNAGDKQFGHTWAEGIQTCQGFATSISVESPLEILLHHVGVIVHPRNNTQQQTNTSPPGNMSGSVVTDSKEFVGIPKITVGICVLYITSQWRID